MKAVQVERLFILSRYLQREVAMDLFLPRWRDQPPRHLILFNDGQLLEEMGFASILNELLEEGSIEPVVIVALHAGEERKQEYGTAGITDYKGRGSKATPYAAFVTMELLEEIYWLVPFLREAEKSFAGFSLGGLSALDIVWNHPLEFSKAGVFSGSFWWRSKALDDGYDEQTDRIMHTRIRESSYRRGLKFFFQTGTLDEMADRNNNGIIDSIDDTLALVKELEWKGYKKDKDITYLEIEGGKHDCATWAFTMPLFLKWGWPALPWK